VGHHTEAFVGIDTSKSCNAIAIVDGGRGGEVRYLGEFSATEAAVRKLVAKLAVKYRDLMFCYEAGPTGYGLYRLLKSLGQECLVVAPSLIPKKAGDRVKTNRRDAVSLAKLLRAGELTAVWVPDERHEAMRDRSGPVQTARQRCCPVRAPARTRLVLRIDSGRPRRSSPSSARLSKALSCTS
jgi:transposase